MNQLITPEAAEMLILEHLPPARTGRRTLAEARGLVLAEDVHADRAFPPFDRAMMDGIACRSADERPYKVHGLHPAGAPEPTDLPAGSCYEIMTGATFPADCDQLIPYEEVRMSAGVAEVTGEVATVGAFIHRAGSDAEAGSVLLKKGHVLTAVSLGIAASAGRDSLLVNLPPRAAIVSTGDELVPVGETPEAWQIRRSNPTVLAAVLQSHGIESTQHHAADSLDATRDLIASLASEHDVICLSGGISKGKLDHVRPALESLFGPPLFHGVAQRPGKPFGLWCAENAPLVFAFPGNPTSTLTCALRYGVPAFLALMGLPEKRLFVKTTQAIEPHATLTVYLSAEMEWREDGVLAAAPRPTRNSGDEVSPTLATGFLHVPAGDELIPAGTVLRFTPF